MRIPLLGAWAGALALAALVYHPCLGFGWVADDAALARGEAVTGLDWAAPWRGPLNGTWRPLRVASYQVERVLAGPGGPAVHHAGNILLHAAAGVMVFLLARKHLAGWAPAAAALYLAHPLQVESVAWITSRKELLGACLGLAAMHLLDLASPGPAPRRRGLGVVCLALACLAREGAVAALPIAVLEGWLLGTPEARSRLGARLVAPASVVLGFLGLYVWMSPLEAAGTPWASGPGERLATMTALWGRAARLLLLPLGLRTHVEGLLGWRPLPFAAGLLVLAGLLALALRLSRTGDRVGLWALAAAVLAYLPASNLLVGIRVPFAEHYLCLSLAFLSMLAASRMSGIRVVFLVLMGMALSAARLPVWTEDRSFWGTAHRQSPAVARFEMNLAAVEAREGRSLEAERRLSRVYPRLKRPEERLAGAWNLAKLKRLRGDEAGARALFAVAAEAAALSGLKAEAEALARMAAGAPP